MIKPEEIAKREQKEIDDLIEQRKLEMSFMLPNQFTFCLGQRINSKPITIKERKN